MEHIVKIEGVCKKHGSKQILEDISFTARSGRITAFLGPNGAGKSSTLRILLGLDRATAGTATFDGRTYQSMTYLLNFQFFFAAFFLTKDVKQAILYLKSKACFTS